MAIGYGRKNKDKKAKQAAEDRSLPAEDLQTLKNLHTLLFEKEARKAENFTAEISQDVKTAEDEHMLKNLHTRLLEKETPKAENFAAKKTADAQPETAADPDGDKTPAGAAPKAGAAKRADTRALFDFIDSQKAGGDRPPEMQKPALRKENIDRNLVSILKPHSFETEMFKVLRGKILHPMTGSPPRSIMVTSAVPGEGKSFVAANLAVTIAEFIREHVLLVDCDLRKPCIHHRFGFPAVPGLSEYLADGAALPPLLLPTMLKKLQILPGGKPPHNPSEILASPKMVALLKELQTRYDDRYLLIDSPPPHMAPETLAISRYIDGIVIVVKHRSTPRDLVLELVNSFERKKIVGVVFNQFDLRSSRYYGYGRYRQYKKYYAANA